MQSKGLATGAEGSPGPVLPSRRVVNGLGFLACAGLLAFAIFYLERALGLEPCPLCMFQRLAFYPLAGLFLLAALHDPKAGGAKVYGGLIGLAAAGGAAISARHIWLQNLPPEEVPACGASLDYMLDAFPLGETIVTVLRGTGDCATIDWSLLGLTIPEWTLICFVGLGIAGVARNFMADRPAAG